MMHKTADLFNQLITGRTVNSAWSEEDIIACIYMFVTQRVIELTITGDEDDQAAAESRNMFLSGKRTYRMRLEQSNPPVRLQIKNWDKQKVKTLTIRFNSLSETMKQIRNIAGDNGALEMHWWPTVYDSKEAFDAHVKVAEKAVRKAFVDRRKKIIGV